MLTSDRSTLQARVSRSAPALGPASTSQSSALPAHLTVREPGPLGDRPAASGLPALPVSIAAGRVCSATAAAAAAAMEGCCMSSPTSAGSERDGAPARGQRWSVSLASEYGWGTNSPGKQQLADRRWMEPLGSTDQEHTCSTQRSQCTPCSLGFPAVPCTRTRGAHRRQLHPNPPPPPASGRPPHRRTQRWAAAAPPPPVPPRRRP